VARTPPKSRRSRKVENEPEGWRQLQEKAQREKDPKKLAALIDQMNQMLAECEKKAAAKKDSDRSRRSHAH
jgi:hypothetical protein